VAKESILVIQLATLGLVSILLVWGKLDLFRYLGNQNNAATQALSYKFFFLSGK
jgi:hypothetical protein